MAGRRVAVEGQPAERAIDVREVPPVVTRVREVLERVEGDDRPATRRPARAVERGEPARVAQREERRRHVEAARRDLAGRYASPPEDIVFRYDLTGAIEDLHRYWQRMVRVVYDPATGLIEVRALAFAPGDAREIARGVFAESALLIDELSAIAQSDTTAFARAEVERAVLRLKDAREAMTAYRSRTQIIDPTADLQGQMGLMSVLERPLAEALIDADLLRETTRSGDPRLAQADRRIGVIEARITEERRNLGVGSGVGEGADYATLVSEFERLAVDRQFAEESYTAALVAFDLAQAEARRKSRYLAAHIKPTLAETPQFPRRWLLTATIGFFSLCVWALSVLVFYSIRDRR